MSITVYGFWRSIAAFRVRVALRLKGLPFEEIPVDILSGEQFQPDYAAVSAERVVPTFIHDGHSIFQSLAIIEYLETLQPEPRLIPLDAKEKAYAKSLALVTGADAHPWATGRGGAGPGAPGGLRPPSACSRNARPRRSRLAPSRGWRISASPGRW